MTSKLPWCLVLLLVVTWSRGTEGAQPWCPYFQEMFEAPLVKNDCLPLWGATKAKCTEPQRVLQAFLVMLGCPAPKVKCDLAGGNQCILNWKPCDAPAPGACEAGRKCCTPSPNSCSCAGLQECLLGRECLGVPGATMVDRTCYSAPTENYACCQKPACNTTQGDLCLPFATSCAPSDSGFCSEGERCCRAPKQPCFVIPEVPGRSCRPASECTASNMATPLADYDCSGNPDNFVCCQGPIR